MSETWTPERIKALRVRHGWTQQEMAVALHVAVPTISRWETGAKKPRGLYVRALEELERQEGNGGQK